MCVFGKWVLDSTTLPACVLVEIILFLDEVLQLFFSVEGFPLVASTMLLSKSVL